MIKAILVTHYKAQLTISVILSASKYAVP